MEQQKHGNLTHFTSSLSLNKTIKKLVLFSLFSFIVFYTSYCTFFLHYVNFYLVAFPWQLLSHALDKSYIFLICNGILVVIAKTSSLVQYSPPGSDHNDVLEGKIVDDLQTSSKIEDSILEKEDVVESSKPQEDDINHGDYKTNIQETDVGNNVYPSLSESITEDHVRRRINEEVKEEQVDNQKLDVDGNGEGSQNELSFNVDDNDEEEETVSYILGGNDHGENGLCMGEEEEKMELLSTEELNKKFEDFIRRMKEDLRIEAQQQLVMVK